MLYANRRCKANSVPYLVYVGRLFAVDTVPRICGWCTANAVYYVDGWRTVNDVSYMLEFGV